MFKNLLCVCVIVVLLTGESTCGQRALYELGMTGIPIYNVSNFTFIWCCLNVLLQQVNNNCSTGSTALMMAKQLVEGGENHPVLRTLYCL